MENVPVDRNRDDVKMSGFVFAEWLLQNEQEIISYPNRNFIFGYLGAVDGQGKDNVHYE